MADGRASGERFAVDPEEEGTTARPGILAYRRDPRQMGGEGLAARGERGRRGVSSGIKREERLEQPGKAASLASREDGIETTDLGVWVCLSSVPSKQPSPVERAVPPTASLSLAPRFLSSFHVNISLAPTPRWRPAVLHYSSLALKRRDAEASRTPRFWIEHAHARVRSTWLAGFTCTWKGREPTPGVPAAAPPGTCTLSASRCLFDRTVEGWLMARERKDERKREGRSECNGVAPEKEGHRGGVEVGKGKAEDRERASPAKGGWRGKLFPPFKNHPEGPLYRRSCAEQNAPLLAVLMSNISRPGNCCPCSRPQG